MTRLAYSLQEAAQAISVSVRSLRYLMATGRLSFVRLGRRTLIRREDLERLLNQGYCRATDRLGPDEAIRPQHGDAPEASTPEASNCGTAEQPYHGDLNAQTDCTTSGV